ncbi:Gfo/Idh/MocA family protein [Cohnella zeiphila]|uniref:Gfo/Idh/MocA family oxidoreductase n=1 Tax=Cohnella zeiphila TaxID=2761120 RepID=A0A7X0SJK5_9BACL|nr:Gfo/Idh/MocA family oxidoreductase [Cohnella zeiphila]MBB6729989.1 Gfo/Idh/MocA family oxidoreductase [Cohnella zeiphila]
MDAPIRLGIVGFGRIVELVHLPTLRKLSEFAVRGIYDLTPQRRELAVRRGFPAFDSLDGLFGAELDAVLVATPPSSHFAAAAEALRRGLHVMIEKPVAPTAEEAERLLTLAAEANRTVGVFHNRRFDPDALLVRQTLRDEALGRVLFAERRHHSFGSGAWFGVKSFRPEWRNERRFGGGALLDWGVHLADQLLHLGLGRYERPLAAHIGSLRWEQGDADDYVQASFRLDSGVLLSFEVNFGSAASPPLWIVGGDRATLQILPNGEATILEKGKPPRHAVLEPEEAKRALGPQRIYESFADCLLRGGPLAVTLEEAAQTMKALGDLQALNERHL